MKNWDIGILGGGASGLAAAITAKTLCPQISVVVFEKKEIAGKKLRVSGNGKCNLSNICCSEMEIVQEFFTKTGIVTRQDSSGRLYPYNESAADVADSLVNYAHNLGVQIKLNTIITDMEAVPEGGFHLFVEEKNQNKRIDCQKYFVKNVLVSTGGKSYAALGTTGDGYTLAKRIGHNVTPLAPGLTGIVLKENVSALKGLRVKGCATLYQNQQFILEEVGEIQFREDGISGICIMNLTNYIRPKREQGRLSFDDYRIKINLTPEWTDKTLAEFLEKKAKQNCNQLGNLLKTVVKDSISQWVFEKMGLQAEDETRNLKKEEYLAIASQLCGMEFSVSGLKGWDEAQITIGGVSNEEVNPATMESKKNRGLYFAGEVLEYAGPCGGYNLHHAWLTGCKAGMSMAENNRRK